MQLHRQHIQHRCLWGGEARGHHATPQTTHPAQVPVGRGAEESGGEGGGEVRRGGGKWGEVWFGAVL